MNTTNYSVNPHTRRTKEQIQSPNLSSEHDGIAPGFKICLLRPVAIFEVKQRAKERSGKISHMTNTTQKCNEWSESCHITSLTSLCCAKID